MSTQLVDSVVPRTSRSGPLLVLAGGLSHERDVSLRSGRRVAEALREEGQEVIQRDMDAELLNWATEFQPSCVVPMLHGETGEDGSLREVLELLGVPYVGTRPGSARLAFDKPVAKEIARRAGLLTPASVALPHDAFRELGAGALMDAAVRQLGLPLLVKPTRSGSALGCSVVRAYEELAPAMVNAFAYGPVALLETFIEGVEVAVPVIEEAGRADWPVVEIRPDGGVYDYMARYTAGATEFVVPTELPSEIVAECQRVAAVAHQSLGLRDISRSDLIVDPSGKVWFLEVNVAPGFTETSLVPLSVAHTEFRLGEVLGKLVRRAVARYP